MTIATYITLSRLMMAVLLVPIIYLHEDAGYRFAVVLFACAIATDLIDGIVARRFNQTTALGARLDPLVDKILIYSVTFSLMHAGAIEPALVFAMFIRDMMVDGLRNGIARTSNILGANFWGKAKFGFQSLSIMCSLGFCITGRAEFMSGANAALSVAVLVSLPGLVIVASAFERKIRAGGGEGHPPFAKAVSAPRFF
jgi:CDP-diacylglycerol---glycerol-3-phosphate 3-phosphatidyltransferase